ncbi:MAG: ABC transporter ATP-binding protein/permease [Spirochaetes bacterium]|nr:ABC transporter ATP-binding protein/permease [Spirochaetota bacterium]
MNKPIKNAQKGLSGLSIYEKQRQKKRKNGIPRLLEIAGTKSALLIFAAFLSIIAVIAQITPFVTVFLLMQELIQNINHLPNIDTGYVWQLGWITLVGIAVFGILTYIAFMCSHVAAFNILYEIRVALSAKLGRLPMGYFTERNRGGIKKIIHEDVERIELFVAHHIIDIVQAVALPIVTFIFLFIIDWRLAIGILIPFPLALLAQFSMYNKSSLSLYTQWQEKLGTMNGTIVEFVKAMPVIKIFNQTVSAFKRFSRDVYAYRDLTIHWTKVSANAYSGFITLLGASSLFIVPIAIYIITQTEVPNYGVFISSVFLFIYIGMGIALPMFKLMNMSSLLVQISTGLSNIDKILDDEEIDNSVQHKKPTDYSIDFKDVSFSYGEKKTLQNLSFTVPQGTVTALVGPSGGGKTTIANLIGRFWDIKTGEISIGQINIKEIGTENLNKYVSTVFQESFLFFDTIEENIRMGNDQASFDEVKQAAQAAQIHDFIQTLPQGYQTLIGEGGTYLSGGEQQRITIARAILKDAPIILLDEATAYADPENEAKIQRALAQVLKNKTVVIIAHRLYTITDVDQILVINAGKIEERGTHQDLLKKNGLYTRLWKIHAAARNWDIGKESLS